MKRDLVSWRSETADREWTAKKKTVKKMIVGGREEVMTFSFWSLSGNQTDFKECYSNESIKLIIYFY